MTASAAETDPYLAALSGRFFGVLKWAEFDALLDRLAADPEGWFIYDTDHAPPAAPADPADMAALLRTVAELTDPVRRLRDVCGTAYVDSPEAPRLVKLFDPWRMGSSCGSETHVVAPPRWIVSRMKPSPLPPPAQAAPPRRRGLLARLGLRR